MNAERYALPWRIVPDADETAIVNRLCDGTLSPQTVTSYCYSWRYALTALHRVDPTLLALPLDQRFTKQTAPIVVAGLRQHMQPDDVKRTLRQLRLCAKYLLGHRPPALTAALLQLDETPHVALPRTRERLKAIAIDDHFPQQHRDALKRLDKAVKKNGRRRRNALTDDSSAAPPPAKNSEHLSKETKRIGRCDFLIWLACLERAGVSWRATSLRELCTRSNFEIWVANMANPKAPWKQAERLNGFACALQHMGDDIDVEPAFALCRELRAQRPGSNAHKERLNKENADILAAPEEDRQRLAFALSKGHAKSFVFEGRAIRLKKRPARDATVNNCLASLRAMTTALAISAPHILQQPTEERDYRLVVKIYAAYYAQYPAITQASRLDHLRSLLIRILPQGYDLFFLDRLIRRLRKKTKAEDIVVHDLAPDAILDASLSILQQTYRRMRRLQNAKTPYRSPESLATLFRNALIVGLLSKDPLRLRSLRLLDVADFEFSEFQGVPVYKITVDAARMKMGKPYTFVAPACLTEWIKIYLHEIRAMLVRDPQDAGDAAWISQEGRRLSASAIQAAIPKLMLTRLGIRVNIQLFRRFVATANIGSPESWRALANTSRMSRKHYQDKRKARGISRRSSSGAICLNILGGVDLDQRR